MQIDIRLQHCAYKCFDCLEMKNPLTTKPVIINIIAGFVPTKQGPAINFSYQHVCKDCYDRGVKKGKYALTEDVAPGYTEQMKRAAMQQSAGLQAPPPEARGEQPGPGGKLVLPE